MKFAFFRSSLARHGLIFFALLFGLSLLLPLSYVDDIYYALGEGSIFSQQAQEYVTSHGRFVTHLVARAILQNRWTADILTALMAMFFLWSASKAIGAQGGLTAGRSASKAIKPEAESAEGFPAHTPLLWVLLVLLCPMGVWLPMVQVAHFASYRLSFALIIVFLLPYLRFLGGSSPRPSAFFLVFWGFVAGSTHEQTLVLAPLLLMAAIGLKLLKRETPRWYWLGFCAVLLGNALVMGSPYGRSMARLIQYGEVLDWEFFGRRLNWLDLGPIRYGYSLAKVLVLWLPLALIPSFIFAILYVKCGKKLGFFNENLLPPLFLFAASWAFSLVMMFSPRIEGPPFTFGMDFLLTALFSLLGVWGTFQNKPPGWGRGLLPWAYTLLLIPLLIQLPAAAAYRQEHWAFVQSLKTARAEGRKELRYPFFKRQGFNTPWGPIRFIYPPNELQRMAAYQGFGDIKIIVESN